MRKLIIAFSLMLTWACQSQNTESTQDLNVQEFKAALAEVENAQLIDVRTDDEIAEGMIPGAKQMDFYGDDFETQLSTLDKEATVFVYCRSGGRSGNAMAMMQKMGFKHVINLSGGMNAWKAAGEKTE